MSATKLIPDDERYASFLEISFAALFSDGFPFAWYWYSIHGEQRRRVVACSIRRTACNLSIQHLGPLPCCLDLKALRNLCITWLCRYPLSNHSNPCVSCCLDLKAFRNLYIPWFCRHPLSDQRETSVWRLESPLLSAFHEFPRSFCAAPDFQTKRIKKIERWLRSLRLMLRDIWFDSFQ